MDTDTLFELGVNLSKGLRVEDKDIARVLSHRDDPQTSYEAADKMVKSGKLSRQERLVLITIQDVCSALCKKHFTPKEIVRWNKRFEYHTIQRRLSGLHRKGKIERTGEKRDGCCVWRLV